MVHSATPPAYSGTERAMPFTPKPRPKSAADAANAAKGGEFGDQVGERNAQSHHHQSIGGDGESILRCVHAVGPHVKGECRVRLAIHTGQEEREERKCE